MVEKIKMIKTTSGTVNNGLTVVHYKEGLIYKTEDMDPKVVKTFLDIKVAEEYVKPAEVVRHEKGLKGAPENKRIEVPEVKEEVAEEIEEEEESDEAEVDESESGENDKVIFTAEELEGAKASDIRELAKEYDVDLSDFPKNASAKVLIEAYLERQ